MKSKIFKALHMNAKTKRTIVLNPRLRLMAGLSSRPTKINKKIVLMDQENKAVSLSMGLTNKLKRGKSFHMDSFSLDKTKLVKQPKTYPEQQERRVIKKVNVAQHIQLRMKVKDGVLTVVGARKVEGGFIKEANLHLNEGLVYELIKGRKRLQFGVIPDFGEHRGFPHPNPKTEAEKGHSIAPLNEFDFNIRVLPKDVSLATLKSLKVNLYRAKTAISSPVSGLSLDKQFNHKLRKMASLERINVTKLPKTLQTSFKKALN